MIDPQMNVLTGAGFWKRFAAYILDYIVTLLIGIILGVILTFAFRSGTEELNQKLGFGFQLMGLIIGWLYFALMESSSKQATLGKMALGIKVTDLNGNRISFPRASGRFFGKLISALILLIGFMMAGWTKKKQSLHDMMASCLVVNKN